MTTSNGVYDDYFEVDERPAEYLIDQEIPYSEMTESELESVIAYREQIARRDAVFEQEQTARAESMKTAVAAHEQAAKSAEDTLNKLVEDALSGVDKLV